MSKQTTKATIDANIKQNGVQAITGQILNSVLNTMVDDYATQEEVTSLASNMNEFMCGNAYDTYNTSGTVYTVLRPVKVGKNIVKVTVNSDYDRLDLGFAIGGNITIKLIDNQSISSGVYYFAANLTGDENRIICGNGGTAANVRVELCDVRDDAAIESLHYQYASASVCGKEIYRINVNNIYNQISAINKLVVLKIENSTDIEDCSIEFGTAGSISAMTKTIFKRKSLDAGTHYYLIRLDDETWFKIDSNGVKVNGVSASLHNAINEDFLAHKEIVTEALCGKELESHAITTYYTPITQRNETIVVKIVNNVDFNGAIDFNNSGAASGNTKNLVNGNLPIGTYYYLVNQNNENYLRCNPIPSGMTISINSVVKDSADDITPESIGAVNKYQNTDNQGKALVVGADGYVTPGYIGQGGVVINGLERKDSKKLYLGNDLLNGNTPTLTGFSGNIASGLTLAARTRGSIVFDFDTESNAAYLITWDMNTPIFDLFVSIGDEPAVDSYRDEVGHVGIVSKGGSLRLEVIGTSNASAVTITNLKMRKVVTEQESTSTYTYACGNIDFGKTSGIDDFWNIAIGTPDVMSSMQNGSRNIAIGKSAAQAFKSGTRNIAIGTFAQAALESGDYNISIGADNFWKFRKGKNNVSLGMTAMGAMDLQTFEAENNVAIGGYALGDSGRGSNVVKGNVALGFEAGYKNDRFGTFVGHQAGKASNGVNNVAVGYSAWASGTGDNNTIVGAYTTANSYSNCIVIGSQSAATKSNQVVIGRQTHTEVLIAGKKIIFNADGTVTWESV